MNTFRAPSIDPELERLHEEVITLSQTDKYQKLARAEIVRNEAIGADSRYIDTVARGIVYNEVRLIASVN